MTELKFLQVLLLQVNGIIKDTYEESIKYSRLKQLREEIEHRINDIDYEKENVKVSKLIRKYKLTDSEKSYLKSLDHNASIGLELVSPIDEYENKDYLCRRESFVSSYDGEINYGYSVYKWDGTYNEKPLFPKSDKTFKFKNWVEIFHSHTDKKISCKDMLKSALELIENTKDVKDEK